MAQSPRHPRTPAGAAPSKDHWLLTERSPDGPAAPFVARIAAVGRRLPATHLTTDELMGSTRHRTHIDLERLTGIHERRVSVGDEDSLSLAVGAARDCLARSGRRAEDIDLVVSCSITKYRDGLVQWLEPTTSLAVARAIGAANATTFDLSNACAGTLTGVLVANNWIRRGRDPAGPRGERRVHLAARRQRRRATCARS